VSRVLGRWRAGAPLVVAILLAVLGPVHGPSARSEGAGPDRASVEALQVEALRDEVLRDEAGSGPVWSWARHGPVARPRVRAQAEDWLRFEHRASFVVDPPARAVRARHELTLTNQQPDQPVAGGVRFTYLPEVGVPVPSGATGFAAARADGRALSVRADATESPFVTLAVVDLSPDLRYPDTVTVVLTYDLPAVPPRSQTALRVNEAFVSFPLFIDGDPGLTSVEVRVPAPFTTEAVGDEMADRSEPDGTTVLTAQPDDPATWFASIVARNDDALLSRPVDLGDADVVIRGWPDDPEWADFAARNVGDGVPILEGLVGLPWPATRTIEVLETAAPYFYGYAGWYQPLAGVIEVGDDLDGHVVLHELSHLWFNAELFEDRWVNEGLAEVFATAAGSELGLPERAPAPIDPAGAGALALNEWSAPDLTQEVSADQEAFGYNASWSVMAQITAEVGIGGLADVVAAADERASAYAGPGTGPVSGSTFGWTELLDLLEDRAGSAVAGPLFAQHVATGEEQAELAARATSRERYAAQRDRSGAWEPPAALRIAMAAWRFDEAEALMDRVDSVLEERDGLVARLDGVAEPRDLEGTYEAATDLDHLEAEVEDAAKAADALVAGDRAARRDVGPLGAVGLLLSSPDDRMASAVAAFEGGRYGAAEERADEAVALVDGAVRAGAIRLGGAATAMALVAALWRRRPARARPGRGSGTGAPDPDAPDPTSPWAP